MAKATRYARSWLMWAWALRKARTKRRGAGPQPWAIALKSAGCVRYLVDGQHYHPPRLSRFLRDVRGYYVHRSSTKGMTAMDREHMVFQEALIEARKMQLSGQYINGSVFHAMDAEIARLSRALQMIADYTPASTVQPVAIARAALKGEAW